MARRPPPGAPSLGRAGRTKKLQPLIIAVCEGATEKKVLEDLRKRHRLSSVQVFVVGEGGDPRNVVQEAKKKQRELGGKKRSKGQRPEVWVAFDRDEHAHWANAIQTARDRGYELAISNPCIELWGLLLHGDQTAELDRHQAQSRLKAVHPGYDHARSPYLDPELVYAGIRVACDRAALLIQRAEDAGDPVGNPTTRFHLLVERLLEVGREWARVNGWRTPSRDCRGA